MIARKNSHRFKMNYRDFLPENLEVTDEFDYALSLMEGSNQNIFITGKAGTGKSTLLRQFKKNSAKNIAVLAPTGVAAINIGGQTIHSFFKFPPRFISKDTIKRKRKSKLIQKLDVMVIDEVSMVRADLMDGIDYALRLNRGRMDEPFGGVQMIFFGDLFQLPPIVESGIRPIFDDRYNTPYFFSAKAFKKMSLRYIELTKIFRQRDNGFVELLNSIRSSEHTKEGLKMLNERVVNGLEDIDNSAVILTTTNSRANAINEQRLAQLPGQEYAYSAEVTGDFEENFYPTESLVRLKEGARVILIRNDPKGRWVNGTLAEVIALSDDDIEVEVDGIVHNIGRSSWEKIEYTYNSETDKIDEEVRGSFLQFPLKLAWAITIHKSQGQTFDKAVVDLSGGAFTHGQVYVALTRCRSLDGVMLVRPVSSSDIIFDRRVYEFQNRFAGLKL
ncbi:MAG: PIF1 family DEAD/DEAH box helicase [Candidatus Omnitrophica bacterium]|nr:PIF1 family DEAD/DEAH box helicase [Candidatus Omnitrophota bacterium]